MINAASTRKDPNISQDLIRSMSIVRPLIQEQTAIATYLDRETARLDELIAHKTRFIELLKEKRSALITHTVTKGLTPNVPMKDSGVEWLGQVPEHWEVKAIKWASAVQRGASPRPIDDQKYFDDNGEYAWVRIADVTASSEFLEQTEQRLSFLGASLSVKMNPDSLFLSIAGTVGKPCITKIKCCIHDGFVYFPLWKGSTKFLYYIFASGEPYKGLGKMGTQLNLNTDTVGGIVIGLPSFQEQTAIATYLDQETARIDELVKLTEQSISLIKERRSALITSAVTGKIDVREQTKQKDFVA
jgi:type I restriction enzyme S subunit